MVWLVLALIAGLNLGQFFLTKLDIWHATGLVAQTIILLIFCYSLFEKQPYKAPRNRPLSLLLAWCGAGTVYMSYQYLLVGKYNQQNFFPFFNFLCIVFLYLSIVKFFSIRDCYKVFNALRLSVICILFLCVLQRLGLSQFFRLLYPDNQYYNNIVVGTLGNGTHLSGFLASCSPLFFSKKREDILCLILLFIILFFTGTNVSDISISGFIILFILLVIWSWRVKAVFWSVILGVVILSAIIGISNPAIFNEQVFNTNGRLEWWFRLWNILKAQFPTGYCLGAVGVLSQKTDLPRHAHLEYLQFLFELGLIGFVLILNWIKKFLEMKSSLGMSFIFKMMVIGFLLSCFFNYPAHLWIPSVYACIAYSCFLVLNERKEEI